jgi:hypothetical protein
MPQSNIGNDYSKLAVTFCQMFGRQVSVVVTVEMGAKTRNYSGFDKNLRVSAWRGGGTA